MRHSQQENWTRNEEKKKKKKRRKPKHTKSTRRLRNARTRNFASHSLRLCADNAVKQKLKQSSLTTNDDDDDGRTGNGDDECKRNDANGKEKKNAFAIETKRLRIYDERNEGVKMLNAFNKKSVQRNGEAATEEK